MAFFNVDNQSGKTFILKYIQDQIVNKTVSNEEYKDLSKAESIRKNDWQDWNNFQQACRQKLDNDPLNEGLIENLKMLDQKYRINNEINDLNSLSISDVFDRRTRYVKRLRCTLYLLSDEGGYDDMDSGEEVYQDLLKRIQDDALVEVKQKIIFNTMVLDFNDRYPVTTNNQYFLDDQKREKIDQEMSELQHLQSTIESGEFSLKDYVDDKRIRYELCYESAVDCFNSVYVSHYEKKDEDDFGLGAIKF